MLFLGTCRTGRARPVDFGGRRSPQPPHDLPAARRTARSRTGAGQHTRGPGGCEVVGLTCQTAGAVAALPLPLPLPRSITITITS